MFEVFNKLSLFYKNKAGIYYENYLEFSCIHLFIMKMLCYMIEEAKEKFDIINI